MLPLLPFFGDFGSSLGPDSPPEGLRSNVVFRVMWRMLLDVGRVGPCVLIVKGLEVPILEKGTLGTEGSM